MKNKYLERQFMIKDLSDRQTFIETLKEIDIDFDEEIKNMESEHFINGLGVGFILTIVFFAVLFGFIYGVTPTKG